MTAHFYTVILHSAEKVTGCCLPSLQDPEANPFHPQDTNSGRRLRSTKTKASHAAAGLINEATHSQSTVANGPADALCIPLEKK